VTVPGSREGECAILDIPGGHGSGYVSLARQATEPASAAETEELRRLLVQYKYPSPYPVRRFSAAHRKELRIAYRRMIAELDHPDVLTPKEQGK
jgi:alpha-ketoglutarate-dependent taurine dioxygenase